MSKARYPTLNDFRSICLQGLIRETIKEKQRLIEDCLSWCSQNCEGGFTLKKISSELRELEPAGFEGLAEAIALPTVVFELDSDAVKFTLAHADAKVCIMVGGKP